MVYKVSRRDYMSEDEFWSLIEESQGEDPQEQLDNLVDALLDMTVEKIAGFDYVLCKMLERSYTVEMLAVADIVLDGCTDEGFECFRMWVISLGRETFENALKDPDSLFDALEKVADEGDEPINAELWYVAGDAYQEMTEKDDDATDRFFSSFDDDFNEEIEIQPTWTDDDPTGLEEICPKIFDRFYDDPLGYDYYEEDEVFDRYPGLMKKETQSRPEIFRKALRFFGMKNQHFPFF